MDVSKILWLNWLQKRSIFARFPALAYLIPYIMGGMLWRLAQVEWGWQGRELRVLPHGVIFLALTLYILWPLGWRCSLLLRSRPGYLLLLVGIMAVGYLYPAYRMARLQLPELDAVQVLGRVEAMTGQGRDEVWVIRPLALHEDHSDRSLPALAGKIEVRQPVWGRGDSSIPGQEGMIRVGDQVILSGRIEEFSRATNPGQFDYARYQHYEGYSGQMWQPGVELFSRPRFSFRYWFARGKEAAGRFFAETLTTEHQPLVMALLTGETDYLNDRELEQIRNLGLSHLLAISGLHLGLVINWLRWFCKWGGVSEKWQPGLLLIALWSAVFFVGARPSALRVGVFLTLGEVGRLLRRPSEPLNLLAVTAWVILLINPLALYLLSFQLSFLVYLAILIFFQPLEQALKTMFPARPVCLQGFFAFLGSSFALSLVAFMGSLPVVLFHFFKVPIQGIGMNLWAVPLAGVFLALILGSLLCGLLWFPLGEMVAGLLDRFVWLFRCLLDYFAAAPMGVWQPGRPLLVWILICELGCWLAWWLALRWDMPLLWRKRQVRIVRWFMLLALITCITTFWFPLPQAGLEWIILDVGQGDGMFLQLPQGEVILVDGGGSPTGDNAIAERVIKPFLLSRGIRRIDLICITHFDADHVRGLLPVLAEFQVGGIWAPAGSESEYWGQVLEIAEKRKIPIIFPVQEQQVQIGPVLLEVLHPIPERLYTKENDRSLVFRLSGEGASFLFTGDLGETAERDLMRSGINLQADFLKVGHHGSKSSTSVSFLQEVAPTFAVISVGKNRYGHPSPEVLRRLTDEGCTVFRTDELGAIRFYHKSP